MSGRSSAAVVATVVLVLVLAACTLGGSASPGPFASGGSSGSPAASATPGEAASSASASIGPSSQPAASRSPEASSSAEASTSPAETVCRETTKAGAVKVSIADFEFKPAAINARMGQVIRFTNTGFESHNATLDNAGCATKTLQTGGRDGLVFTVAGSYPFHCTVHAWMTGTITIGG